MLPAALTGLQWATLDTGRHNMYIAQKNTEGKIVVIGNAEAALTDYPELFEQVAGDAPEDASFLNYSPPDVEQPALADGE